MKLKRTSIQARLSISGAIATMRSAQGVEDKEEARREIKRSIQVNTKVSTNPQT
jgi:hypothetical protein